MSEPKFTPGPWEVSPTGKYVRRVQPNYSVCMLSDAVLDDWIANARLIAAAPELFAVAQAVCMFHGVLDWNEGVAAQWRSLTDEPATTKGLCNFARAAIVKAVVR